MQKLHIIPAILALCTAADTASAALIINIQQSGSNVVVMGAGTMNIAGMFFTGSFAPGSISSTLSPIGPSVIVAALPVTSSSWYQGPISIPQSFGIGSGVFPSVGFGDQFGVGGGTLFVPVGYISGSPLSGTSIYAGASFASLGITPGTTRTWTWGSGANTDSATVTISPVPEPTTLALGATAGLMLFGSRRRARQMPAATLAK